MRYRHHLDLQIAKVEVSLDTHYAAIQVDAQRLCQRLLGPRCRVTARWISAVILLSLAVRKWRA